MGEERTTREEKIHTILDQEIQDGERVAAAVKEMAARMLREIKGYLPSDVERDVVFDVRVGSDTVKPAVDLVVSVDGEKAMIIKCAPGSLTSRERQAVALARLISVPPVPVAVVMDPAGVVVLDSMTGKVMGEGDNAIPSKEEMRRIMNSTTAHALSPSRIEKEKRILLAFDALRCSIPRGADGGVSIDDACEK